MFYLSVCLSCTYFSYVHMSLVSYLKKATVQTGIKFWLPSIIISVVICVVKVYKLCMLTLIKLYEMLPILKDFERF